MKPFVHLHVHTEYSLLDGIARIKKVVKTAKAYGMPALAITDHGNMYGAVSFFDACEKEGIKAIIGCEFYVCDDIRVKSGKSKLNHLVLLAKDETGYKNLSLLNAIAFRDGFYYKPRIDLKTLEKHSEGLVCLSACLAGDIPQAIINGQFEEAERLVVWFKDLFKDDFYLELQNHHIEEQIIVNQKLKEYANKFGIKTVATNDVHYINKDDAEMQDVLMCVQMGKTYNDPDRLKFPCDEFYLKTYDEMSNLFPNDLDALDTSLEIAEKCNFKFEYGHYLFPHYYPENGDEPLVFLRKLIDEGIAKKYGQETEQIRERVERELHVISSQGFVEYFLIVWDYINAARNMGISVGPGRGSGAGSIVAYTIGITDIDPLKYDLLFERFLHTERVSAPDFDIDFEDSRRGEVIEYVRKKYGADRVVRIVTFGTMAAKNAIKDVGRVLQVPYSKLDAVTKAIPTKISKNGTDVEIKRPNILQKVFGHYKAKEGDNDFGVDYSVPELLDIYNSDHEIKKVVDIAMKLEDAPRQCGIHACGVIIGADILDKHVPLSKNGDDLTTQFTGVEMEHLGHLKMDFLGLRNLTDIKMCQKLVKENYNVDVDFSKMEFDDPKVFQMISTGNTNGIFQVESGGFQKFLKDLKPTCIEDIIAAVALFRPGPMKAIPRFVNNKHHPEQVTYAHPILAPILKETYGCIVYQEQVMRIVQDMAGYTLGQADMVRRMMGKKKVDDMIREKQVFLNGKPESVDKHGKVSTAIDGAIKRGVSEEVANQIWAEMEDFAKYAFNKSHAAAYSFVIYQTAYLKTYFEAELLTSILNNRITNSDEIKNYVAYAKTEKLEILPPDINKSESFFTVKDKKIRYGLAALKNVGIAVTDSVVQNRKEQGEFKSLEDLISRLDGQALNKRFIESMILSGALDCFGKKRSQMMQVYSEIVDRTVSDRKNTASGQFSLFDVIEDASVKEFNYPNIPEFNKQVKLKFEKEVVGTYVSGHPLEEEIDRMKQFNLTSDMLVSTKNEDEEGMEEDEQIDSFEGDVKDGMKVVCGGIITETKKLYTKNGNREMAFVKIEDLYGEIEVMVFPNTFEKQKTSFNVDNLITIYGKLSIRQGEKPVVLCEKVDVWQKQTEPSQEQIPVFEEELKPVPTLYLKYSTLDDYKNTKIMNILAGHNGPSNVVIKCSEKLSAFKASYKVNITDDLLLELRGELDENYIIVK